MVYKVLDVFAVGENTSVTVVGNGQGLKNDMTISTPNGEKYKLLAVGLTTGESTKVVNKSTTLLVQGEFTAMKINIYKEHGLSENE